MLPAMPSPPLRTILVTGASRGIGRAFAEIAAAKGHDLVLVARSADAIAELATELEQRHGITATHIPLDLANPDCVDRLTAEIASRGITIDALVNNAGLGSTGEFHEARKDTLRNLFELNMVTLAMLTREFLPGMVERGKGAVLNVASVAGFNPGPHMAAYHASKAFVVSLSMATRSEVQGTGVSVTCLCPGPVDTGFTADAGQIGTTGPQRLVELSPERVAQDGYDAMVRGKAICVPGAPMKIATQLSRHAPLKVVTAITGRALRGTRTSDD